jgi:hypothetical protein
MSGENIEYKERIVQTHEFINTCIKNYPWKTDEKGKQFIEGMMYATALIENKPPKTIRMMQDDTQD